MSDTDRSTFARALDVEHAAHSLAEAAGEHAPGVADLRGAPRGSWRARRTATAGVSADLSPSGVPDLLSTAVTRRRWSPSRHDRLPSLDVGGQMSIKDRSGKLVT